MKRVLSAAVFALALSFMPIRMDNVRFGAIAHPVQFGSVEKSANWSGYAVTGSTFTDVSGSWIVQTVHPASGGPRFSSQWLGIGGYATQDLIQTGTESNWLGPKSTEYDAWVELLPNDETPMISVRPGDVISADIKLETSGNWLVSLTDITSGESFSQAYAYSSCECSAEWIEERPWAGFGLARLTHYRVAYFGKAYTNSTPDAANGEPPAAFALHPIDMYNSGTPPSVVSSPGAMADDGSFLAFHHNPPGRHK